MGGVRSMFANTPSNEHAMHYHSTSPVRGKGRDSRGREWYVRCTYSSRAAHEHLSNTPPLTGAAKHKWSKTCPIFGSVSLAKRPLPNMERVS